MAFLKRLFGGKDADYYIERGDRFLLDGRYADARIAYSDALDRLGDNDESIRNEVTRKRSEAGDSLARANMEEAERALTAGSLDKARDHAELARELSSTPEIIEQTEELLSRVLAAPPVSRSSHGDRAASCACIDETRTSPDNAPSPPTDGHLSSGERFELMTAALPGDLPQRYRALGERFAESYLLSHDGHDEKASRILEELTLSGAQDIILYERAIILHRQGKERECETLLRQAIVGNDRNPLCYLALVDLYAGSNRPEEALTLLETMIRMELMPEQAVMLRGDILHLLGRDEEALENYAALFMSPFRKEAATRVIPILEQLGRSVEARQVFTQYVKGCC